MINISTVYLIMLSVFLLFSKRRYNNCLARMRNVHLTLNADKPKIELGRKNLIALIFSVYKSHFWYKDIARGLDYT